MKNNQIKNRNSLGKDAMGFIDFPPANVTKFMQKRCKGAWQINV